MHGLELIDNWPVSNVATGVLTADGGAVRRGPTERPFLLASVTKPLVALAVLVAVEEGTLNLDGRAGDQGPIISDLLCHASGLGPGGEKLAEPGRRRIYSNYGFELLAFALERAADMPMASYLHEAIAVPLGLTETALVGSAAHGAVSCVEDLMKICAEFMNPTLLSPQTITRATTPVYPELAGVLPGYGPQSRNQWGLGVEIRGEKSPHWTGSSNSASTFGHFGQAGTFFWVDPAAGVGCVALTDEPFGPWAIKNWPPFSDAVLVAAPNR